MASDHLSRSSSADAPKAFGARQENSLILRQSPRWMQVFALLLALISGSALIAGFIIRIDEVVSATGQLESTGGRVTVKSPVPGKISRLLVRNGERVKRGQLLLVMDTTLANERIGQSERLIALEKEGLDRQVASLEEQLRLLDHQIRTQNEITSNYESLLNSGGISKIQVLQQRDKVFQLETQRSTTRVTIERTRIEAQKRIRELETQAKEALVQRRYQNLIAPSDGIVFDLRVQDAGVVEGGEVVLTLIPQQGLTANVNVSNKDIGFIKVGQKATVRVDAFPANRYGELNGKVSLIGADALPPDEISNTYRFPIKISLDKNYLQADNLKIPLSSGMSISSNLRIRDKPLITLVSDLLAGQFDSIKSLRQ